jgi:hypothetical protein
LGLLVALACREGVSAHKNLVVNRYLLGVVLFELFFFIPLGAYLYFFYPDWSLMYFVDPGTLDQGARVMVGATALCGYMAAIVSGYILAARLLRTDRDGAVMIIFIATALILGVFSLVTMSRLMGIGAYSDWIATPRTTLPLITHRVGIITGIAGAVATIALLSLLRTLRQIGPSELDDN